MSKFAAVQRNHNSNNAVAENIVFKVVSYHYDNPGKVGPGDYIEAVLCHDAVGLTAEFDENNEPITPIKIKLSASDAESRPTILQIERGFGTAKAMPAGSIGIADRAYPPNKNGFISSAWINRFFPSPDYNVDYPVINEMISVRDEKVANEQRENAYQGRYVAYPDMSQPFTGLEQFKEAAGAAFAELENANLPKDHGIIVRVVDLTDPTSTAEVSIYRRWDSERQDNITAAEAIENFLSGESTASWKQILEDVDSDVFYEAIPVMRVRTGQLSLPSARANEARKKLPKGTDLTDAQKARYDDSNDFKIIEGGVSTYGFTQGHMAMTRKGDGPWFAKNSKTSSTRPVILRGSELITPALSEAHPEVAQAIVAHATERSRSRFAPVPEADGEEDTPPTPVGM